MHSNLYRAWYLDRDGHEVPARGRHGSICLDAEQLELARRAAARNGHPLVRELQVVTHGDAIVAEALRYLGVHEMPRGSNDGPQVGHWLERVHCPRRNPWCAAFVSCMLEDAGYPLEGGGSASCWQLRQRAIAEGKWVPVGTAVPLRGWLGIVKGDAHVVIVEAHSSGRVHDVSGNTSAADGSNYDGGEVARHTHDVSIFAGFIRTY